MCLALMCLCPSMANAIEGYEWEACLQTNVSAGSACTLYGVEDCSLGYYCVGGYNSVMTQCPDGSTSDESATSIEDCYKIENGERYYYDSDSGTFVNKCSSKYVAITENDAVVVARDDAELQDYLAQGYTVLGSDVELGNCLTDDIDKSPVCTYYNDTYTVTYNCNGGVGSGTDSVTYNSVFTPRTDVCSRDGYRLAGYTINGKTVEDSFTWTYSGDRTMYAQWELASVTCVAGKYLPANSTECTTCPANSYCPGGELNVGSTSDGISSCPANSTSVAGSSSCTCNDGYYMNGGTCIICPIGSYCANNIKVSCDTDYTTDGTGASKKSQCYKKCWNFCQNKPECPANAICSYEAGDTEGKLYYGSNSCETSECDQIMTVVGCVDGYEMVNGTCTRKCDDGYYLEYGECVICPANSYCENGVRNDCPDDYRRSYQGAKSKSQCYEDCEMSCVRATECPDNATCDYNDSDGYFGEWYYGASECFVDEICIMDVMCNPGYVLTEDNTCRKMDVEPTFVINTTPMNAGDEFWFYLSAAGTYYVDWGDGKIQEIVKTSRTNERIAHVYEKDSESDGWTIKMSGIATGYNTDTYNNIAAIRFTYDDSDVVGNPYLYSVSGSLGAIFPTLPDSTSSKKQPSFRRLFTNCENLTGTIPENLFKGVYSNDQVPAAGRMFMSAFQNTAINGLLPSGLFADMSGPISENLFRETFSGCSELTGEIPSDLFANLSGQLQARTFYATFQGCAKLEGYIPPSLFANVEESSASSYMLDIFNGSGIATSCEPYGMTQYITKFDSWFGGHVSCMPEAEFSFTVDMPAGETLKFAIGAAGTYFIDWGDNTEAYMLNKNDVSMEIVSHVYTNAGTYTVNLMGQADAYYTSESSKHAAISFSSEGKGTNGTANAYKYLTDIDGSLGAIFGTLAGDVQPRFNYTFYNCANLAGDIPENLFSGISGQPISFMFDGTFKGCTGLTEPIPGKLFSGITGTASHLFSDTFARITPSNGGKLPMAFTGSIPAELFASVQGTIQPQMFYNTFYGCESLTGEIPKDLFKGISGELSTESGVAGTNAFRYTFEECSSLTGFIPPELFAGFTYSYTGDYPAKGPMYDVFKNASGLRTVDDGCPDGMSVYSSVFEPDWSDHISCYIPDFEITTTQMNAGDEFKFTIVAAGDFTINWGDGHVTHKQYDEPKINDVIGHKYTKDGSYKIGIIGKATAYLNPESNNFMPNLSAISFLTKVAGETANPKTNACDYIEGISGSLGKLFPTLENNPQPMFRRTFGGCTKMKGQISEDLFKGITGAPMPFMFDETFLNCSELTGTIPGGLFSGLDGEVQRYTFYGTFSGCTGLNGAIPGNLFSGIKSAADNSKEAFSHTFYNCTGLTGEIPHDLFKMEKQSNLSNRMFSETFSGCSGLTGKIPEDLFASLSFEGTIDGASSNATSDDPGAYAFFRTFKGCSKLDPIIPERLFSRVSGNAAYSMFKETFKGAFAESEITDATVPAGLFENITYSATYPENGTGVMQNIFADSGIMEGCPEGMDQFYTGYEGDWSGRAVCVDADVSRVLHVGDAAMKISPVKPNTPRIMVFQVLDDLYYGGLSDTEKTMSKDTDKKFRIFHDNNYYWLHDYTVK